MSLSRHRRGCYLSKCLFSLDIFADSVADRLVFFPKILGYLLGRLCGENGTRQHRGNDVP